jgi:hypothetical protein
MRVNALVRLLSVYRTYQTEALLHYGQNSSRGMSYLFVFGSRVIDKKDVRVLHCSDFCGGCVIADAVRRWFAISVALVQSQVKSCDISGGRIGI